MKILPICTMLFLLFTSCQKQEVSSPDDYHRTYYPPCPPKDTLWDTTVVDTTKITTPLTLTSMQTATPQLRLSTPQQHLYDCIRQSNGSDIPINLWRMAESLAEKNLITLAPTESNKLYRKAVPVEPLHTTIYNVYYQPEQYKKAIHLSEHLNKIVADKVAFINGGWIESHEQQVAPEYKQHLQEQDNKLLANWNQ